MNAREIAKITMHNGFGAFLDENGDIFAGFLPLVNKRTQLATAVNKENELAKTQSVESSGQFKSKNDQKKAMAENAAMLAGLALVAFKEKGKSLEASKLLVSTSDYLSASDSEAKILAEGAYDFMTAHLTDLSPDYVSADDLAELRVKISQFESSKGNTHSLQQTSPAATKAFKSSLKESDDIIDDIRLLARKYRSSNPVFYEQLIAVSSMPSVAVHHTTFSAKVNSKSDGIPVSNATAALTSSNKKGNSDNTGFLTIEQVRSGVATLTIAAPGFKELAMQVNLDRGKDNYLNVELEKISQ